ncbi:MAG: hypothetical protein RLZ12_276 [Bacillota bacterium]|jgi:glycerol-3-phosphate acyltransferase PlsX
MHILCDLDGGDNAPAMVLAGVKKATSTWPKLKFTLLGHEKPRQALPPQVTYQKVSDKITAAEHPIKAVRTKANSSIVIGCNLLKKEAGDLFISAGNTGALIAAGLLHTGRIPGLSRPALAPLLPNNSGGSVLVIDAGSNPEAKAKHLHQYALLGSSYLKHMLNIEKPRVGLLNIGTENEKGSALTQETFFLLANETKINFVGNVEAREAFTGACDVLVCDGFAGNVLLKSGEGMANILLDLLKKEVATKLIYKFGAILLRPALKKIYSRLDHRQYGGIPILGLTRTIFKAHGSADETTFFNAIKQAKKFIDTGLNKSLTKNLCN